MGALSKIAFYSVFLICVISLSGNLLKPVQPKKKTLSGLKEEAAKCCERSLECSRMVRKKLLDWDEKTVNVFKKLVDDDLSREELESSILELKHIIATCESFCS